MFGDKFQGKLISVYHSVGSHPLADWLVQVSIGLTDACKHVLQKQHAQSVRGVGSVDQTLFVATRISRCGISLQRTKPKRSDVCSPNRDGSLTIDRREA